MGIFKKLFITLRAQGKHPLNRKSNWRAAWDFAVAQVAARLVPGEVCVPFPNETRLLIPPRMKGAAHFIYPGLCEFEDMAFVMHFLRSTDMFIDAGANIGAYTVLAAGVAGSRVLAFEPAPTTFRSLELNIQLNGLANRATGFNLALGREDGILRMTEGLGTENSICQSKPEGGGIEVPVRALDRLLGETRPALLKIDVEGFETEVFAGAVEMLRQPTLEAMIVEKSGNGGSYGFDEDDLHREIQRAGFLPCAYAPLQRSLCRLSGEAAGNIIYVRNIESSHRRLRQSPPFRIAGCLI